MLPAILISWVSQVVVTRLTVTAPVPVGQRWGNDTHLWGTHLARRR